MLSLSHELPLRFLDGRPGLALELAAAGGLHLPSPARLAVSSGDMSRTGSVTERRVDKIVLLHDEAGSTVGALLVEVQQSIDTEARQRWPGKLVEAWERHRCEAYLLVLCTDIKVARWASKPLRIGAPEVCGLTHRVLVIPPQGIPRIDTADRVSENPELAVLSSLAHGGEDENDTVLPAFMDAFTGLLESPQARAHLNYSPQQYINYLYDAGQDVIKRRMEKLMTTTDGYVRYSIPFLRDAQDQAYDKAFTETAVNLLLEVLEVRGVELGEDQRRQITECTDNDQLDTWFRRAATANHAKEVFD